MPTAGYRQRRSADFASLAVLAQRIRQDGFSRWLTEIFGFWAEIIRQGDRKAAQNGVV